MKRTISGIVYVAVLLAFYLLKVFVHDLCFDVLTYAFAIIGTIEMLKASQAKTTKAERVIVMIFAIVSIPLCAFFETMSGYGVLRVYGLHVMFVLFFVLAVALLCLFVIRYEETTLESVGYSFLSAVYPTFLLSLLILTNHVPEFDQLKNVAFNSDLLILFIFVISPCSDCFALVVGSLLKKKFPQKFAPAISPNKTLVGFIGGLLGGVLGSVALYFVYNGLLGIGSFENMWLWLFVYAAIGFVAAAATMFGDLVESGIKRKLGVKDMGNLIPGHGGILDRIDGTLFATMIVNSAFALIRLVILI